MLTLVTMAGETTGKRCTARIVGGSGKRQRGPTAPAGREFDSVSPCAASCHAVHLSLPPLLSSPFYFIPLFAMPHLTVLALSSFLVLPCFSFCTRSIPSSSLLLKVCYCVNVWNIVDSISSQPSAVDRNVMSQYSAYERNANSQDSVLSVTVYEREF